MNKTGLALISVMITAVVAGIVFMLRPAQDPAVDWVAEQPTTSDSAPVAPSPAPEPLSSSPSTTPPKAAAPAATAEQMAEWEGKISEALSNNDISNEVAVQRLLSLAYDIRVDEGVRLDALEHSLNLTEDEGFAEVLPLLKDKEVPIEMLDSILTDLYNRGDRVKLESVLEVARIPDHPLNEDALELLEFYVDENHGEDWNAWGEALTTYFTENEIE